MCAFFPPHQIWHKNYVSKRGSMASPLGKVETTWRCNNDWKARYSKLYSSQSISLQKKEEPRRISFMSNDSTPYATLLSRVLTDCSSTSKSSNASNASSPYFQSSQTVRTVLNDDLGRADTRLLDMVRSRSSEAQNEARDVPTSLPQEEESDEASNDICMHGLNYRMTERSVSRSRVSRISTRRDMDIPSILAFPTNITAPVHLEIPAFQKIPMVEKDPIPKWSIRRSICPVCSQKWKDRSSIKNVKNSGLKRNSSVELPSVIAPARLRTSIGTGYVPRPFPAAVDKEAGMVLGGLHRTSTTWQLTRARRFRAPKPQMPPPESRAPPSCAAPMARKDIDLRVTRFIKDESA